jgi:aromatic-L-amino-acid decarboxylase
MPTDRLNEHNERLLAKVNASREVYLSHTRVCGSYALRVAIGNVHTGEAHVRRALDLVRQAGALK